jgi:hypothetical protein
MPKKILEHVQQMLNDRLWLISKHVDQCFSIVELARELGITPATVQKSLRRHGIQSPTQQSLREASNKRKYGVTNPGAVPEFHNKAIATMVTKYGGHNWSLASNKRTNRDQTCLERFGNSNVGGTDYAKDKAKQTNIERYARVHKNQSHLSQNTIDNLLDRDWLYQQHFIEKKTLSQIAKELGINDMTTVMRYLHCHGLQTQYHASSYEENQLADFVSSIYNGNIKRNDRDLISPYELDIILPDLKLAIEYCGLFWHTEESHKGRYYHKIKWEKCKAQQYRLITIFSDEWNNKQDIVKQMLQQILGVSHKPKIHARACTIVSITTDKANSFLNENHIRGGKKSASIFYGLQHEGNIVAIIAMKHYKNDTWYLERYATSCNVRGGHSKLLNYFKKHHQWREIITFSDLRWSNGDLYDKTGFLFTGYLKPDYEYVVNNQRVHKFNYRRAQLDRLLPHYDPLLSEAQNTKKAGIERIWNCGLKRYVMINDSNTVKYQDGKNSCK